mgnify:CR=1 FL=1
MPQEITDVNQLQMYLQGVMQRAEHHAGSVDEVVLALAGAIIWKKDDEPIEVMAKDGDMKNVMWVKINGIRYAFSYAHSTGKIEVRRKSTQGETIREFSDTDTPKDVKAFFEESL